MRGGDDRSAAAPSAASPSSVRPASLRDLPCVVGVCKRDSLTHQSHTYKLRPIKWLARDSRRWISAPTVVRARGLAASRSARGVLGCATPLAPARSPLSGPRHQAGVPRGHSAPPVRALQGAPRRVRPRLPAGRVPHLPVLDPGQPHPPDLRGQRRDPARARDPGLVGARRARPEPPPRPHRRGVRRPLSRRDPHHADADPPRPLLCAPECPPPRRAHRSALRRHGPVLVRVVVRRLAGRLLEGRYPAAGDAHVAEAETWLLKVGWKRSPYGLLSITDSRQPADADAPPAPRARRRGRHHLAPPLSLTSSNPPPPSRCEPERPRSAASTRSGPK